MSVHTDFDMLPYPVRRRLDPTKQGRTIKSKTQAAKKAMSSLEEIADKITKLVPELHRASRKQRIILAVRAETLIDQLEAINEQLMKGYEL